MVFLSLALLGAASGLHDGVDRGLEPPRLRGGPGGGGMLRGAPRALTCNADGSSSTYAETIGTSSGVATRTIDATGCPNHAERGVQTHLGAARPAEARRRAAGR